MREPERIEIRERKINKQAERKKQKIDGCVDRNCRDGIGWIQSARLLNYSSRQAMQCGLNAVPPQRMSTYPHPHHLPSSRSLESDNVGNSVMIMGSLSMHILPPLPTPSRFCSANICLVGSPYHCFRAG